jgi:hypothetical protein
MTPQEWTRLIWLTAALAGIGISTCLVRYALADRAAASKLPVPNGRRLIASMLLRDEVIALTLQGGFVLLAVWAWIIPTPVPLRSLGFAALCLLLGIGSLCRWHDRRSLH